MSDQNSVATIKQENSERNGNSLLESVNHLQGFSSALSTFTVRFNELQGHLDSIQKSIETRSKQLESKNNSPEVESQKEQALEAVEEPDSLLEIHCRNMNAKGLRKYVARNLSDIAKIRSEAPMALKSAPDPEKLVLECVGSFYLQGIKAYIKSRVMVSVRQACVLILECFLISGPIVSDSAREEAEKVAILWRNRIVNEGGIANAKAVDALGLLLFISSYGIPFDFTRDDIYELIQLSNLRKKADVLRKSPLLVEKIPDIIQGLVDNGMHVKAADLAIAFELKDKFCAATLLKDFLKVSKEATKKMRREGVGSGAAQIEAAKKRYADLKAVIDCLEDHDLEKAQEFSSWKLGDQVAKLEREINSSKRKADELGAQEKPKTNEAKRLRPNSLVTAPSGPNPTVALPKEVQRNAGSFGGEITFNVLPAKNDSWFPGLFDGFPGISVRASTGLLVGNGVGPCVVSGGLATGNVAGPLVWRGPGAFNNTAAGQGPVGPSAPTAQGLLGPSSAMGQGLLRPSSAMGQGLQGPSPVMGQGLPGPSPAMGQGVVGLPLAVDKSFLVPSSAMGPSLLGPSSSFRGQSLLGPSPAMAQGVLGTSSMGQILLGPSNQSLGIGNRSPHSNLYRFADSVLAGDPNYSGSYSGNSAVPVYQQPSYLR